MAWTVSRTHTVFGNKRAVILNLTADAATQTVETGLSVVEGVSKCIVSCNSANHHIAFNSNASGVQSMGVLGLTGFTSGDVICAVVFGK